MTAPVATNEVKGPWFDVPAGTRAARCRSCRNLIYWIVTAKGKRMPVDCDVAGGQAPAQTAAGRGVAHFATCAQAEQWRTRA